jgi:CheY-like chemotaxis protein
VDEADVSPGGEAGSPGPLRILLVEDGKANQTAATGLLRKWGHRVELVDSGQQAVDASQRGDFDAIVMDVQMPHVNGLEATRLIRQREAGSGRRIPIIAMTGHAVHDERQRCLEAGMDDYLSKPLRKHELGRAIGSLPTAVLTRSRLPDGESASAGDGRASQDENQIIDWNAAFEILGGSRKFHCEQVRKTVQEMHSLLPMLSDAIYSGSTEPARRIASSVKNAASSIVATRTTKAAAEVEQAAAVSDFEAALCSLSRLIASIEELDRATEVSEH